MDSDDEIEETPKWEGSPGTIVLINALEDSNTIDVAHEATCLLIRQYLRSSSSHNIGVCLYGTDKTQTDLNSNNIIDIISMDTPTLEGYKKLRATDIASYGKAKEYILSEVLWHCSKIFKDFKKKLSSQTVLILTKLLNPPVKTDQKRSIDRVVNLVGSYTKIIFINISQNDYPIDKFYKELLIDINKSQEYTLPQAVWNPNVIQNMMYQQSHRHLAVAKLSFEVGPGFSIGVGVYSLLRKSNQSYLKTSNIDANTNEAVTRVTMRTKVTVNSGDSPQDGDDDVSKDSKELPLLDSELLFCQEYGGERIEFTKKEKEEMSNPFGPPMLKLLGFKPAIKLCKEKWFLKTGYFLYPNESVIEGSTIAFKALHKACDEMKTVAICMLCTRANSRPNIVALAPCTRPLDLEIEIGFDVIHIPFAENVREIPQLDDESEKLILQKKQKEEMNKILNSLQFNYKADMFENPKLQSQYRAIEAKALQEISIEPFVDTTIQKPEVYQVIREDVFEELFGPFGVSSIKRSCNTDKSNTVKKIKTEDINENLVQEMIVNKSVDKLTVAQIKNVLKKRDITFSKSLNKSDLCKLVYENCAS
ncbi:X-ray repair cross-complementing protein 6 [Papilio machaon]|uniref:X-ray repair cross-complementing protein 6 n=1 Tax=Papilio machaon TaxID=76193 RepID=UPI001E6636B0|nr:X-ray repair cross-complementing protein 6 [Papilio machaon]